MAFAIHLNGGKHTYLSGTFINPYTLRVIVAPIRTRKTTGPIRNCVYGATQRKLYIVLQYMG